MKLKARDNREVKCCEMQKKKIAYNVQYTNYTSMMKVKLKKKVLVRERKKISNAEEYCEDRSTLLLISGARHSVPIQFFRVKFVLLILVSDLVEETK